MDSPHALDRPARSALTTCQAIRALGDSRALRFRPEGRCRRRRDASRDPLAALGALSPDEGASGVGEVDLPPTPPALVLLSSPTCE